jgi:chemotaxis response regulator CheB
MDCVELDSCEPIPALKRELRDCGFGNYRAWSAGSRRQAAGAGSAIVVGLLNGGLDGVELVKAHFSAQAAAGVVIAPFLLVALLAGNIAAVLAPWVRIAVRVVGNWIAASGLFMLGWALRRV